MVGSVQFASVPSASPSFHDAALKPGATGHVSRLTTGANELETLSARSAAGERLTPVEQGTLARLSAAAAEPKVKTSADFTITGATPEDIKQLDAALKYLSASPTAAALLDKLPVGAKLAINHEGVQAFDPNTNTINWDPTHGGLINKGADVVSPALILAHETDHAVAGITPLLTFDRYDNTEEKRVITGSERQIATDLGEAVRDDHRGELVAVASSTSKEALPAPGAPSMDDFSGK